MAGLRKKTGRASPTATINNENKMEQKSEMLEKAMKAIREGRAYLDTGFGRRKVTSYNHNTGWAITSNGDYWSQRSFLITLDSIKY